MRIRLHWLCNDTQVQYVFCGDSLRHTVPKNGSELPHKGQLYCTVRYQYKCHSDTVATGTGSAIYVEIQIIFGTVQIRIRYGQYDFFFWIRFLKIVLNQVLEQKCMNKKKRKNHFKNKYLFHSVKFCPSDQTIRKGQTFEPKVLQNLDPSKRKGFRT